ncbi:MAG: UvrD-helicase domain-containing protein [Bacteroidia bacterium]|nr:UvrD-helicase domain-containing protein [Bacteroidia bacterium]
MQLSEEQEAIIASKGDIRINAVAGSGKTSTLIAYAKTRPKGSRILYLAYNKSVRTEAIEKFEAAGLSHVQIETAHSLAYKHVVFRHNYKVKPQAYKSWEIANLLALQADGEKHASHMVAGHISKYLALFCNSAALRVADINYAATLKDAKAKKLVNRYNEYITYQTRLLLAKMDKGEIEISHDFYLKKFQLSRPKLDFDFILFDEGQDASAAMLDVFLNQQATKVIVGDTHQQIYAWRHAVNSLESVNFPTFTLNKSFRFPPEIAALSREVLSYKSLLGWDKLPAISGAGKAGKKKSQALLSRSNLGLLVSAINYLEKNPKTKGIYFEGHIHSYTYADDGASLYDVLNLSLNKRKLIRDPLIQLMRNLEDLEEYIDSTEDMQLGMMLELVETYGEQIPELLKKLKEKHCENKQEAELIFSTVHKAKGMEYDTVELGTDFITLKRIEKMLLDEHAKEEVDQARLIEEVNLLYVAITRCKNLLRIPESILPEGVLACPHIEILEKEKEEEAPSKTKAAIRSVPKEKDQKKPVPAGNTLAERQQKYGSAAYRPWTKDLDEELKSMYYRGTRIKEIAAHFNRSQGAILARVAKLGLDEL